MVSGNDDSANKDRSRMVSRRQYLSVAGAGTLSLPFITATGSAVRGSENLLLLSGYDKPLSVTEIVEARTEYLKDSQAKRTVAVQDANTIENELAAYKLDVSDGTPQEKFWEFPKIGSDKTRKRLLKAIHAEAKDHTFSPIQHSQDLGTLSPASAGDGDGINADREWDYLGQISYNSYGHEQAAPDPSVIDVTGREDGLIRMFETSGSDGKRQLGCVVKMDQWPGYYLERNSSSVDDNVYDWYNAYTTIEQNWAEGDTRGEEYIDLAPSGKKETEFDGSVTFEVTSTGPSLSLTLTPKAPKVKYIDKSDPDKTVKTRFEYGTPSSEESHVIVGNDGIFLVDDDGGQYTTPLRVHTNCWFYAWDGFEPYHTKIGRNYGVDLTELD